MALSADVEIWHNPRCGKSRTALAWLTARGIEPKLRLYLQDPPDSDELRDMLAALSLPAAALLRKDAAALAGLSEAEILAALAADPAKIERPVVRRGLRAVIARPTETLDALFG